MAEPARTGARPRGRPATARRGARVAGPRAETLVNWSLYRLGWIPPLLCGLILLVAAETPGTLRAAELPATFDGGRALVDARALALQDPDRSPGSGGSTRAAAFIEARLRGDGLAVSRQRFAGRDADGRPVTFENVLAIARPAGVPAGRLRAVLVLAHRDDVSPGPGANDDASGSAVLLGLADALPRVLENTALVLASTDGATAGSAGARYLARHPPPGLDLQAVLTLNGVGRPGPLRLRLGGEDTRLAAAGLVRSAQTALRGQGLRVQLPGLGSQLLGLIAPLGRGEQTAFVRRGIPAVGIAGDPAGLRAADDRPEDLRARPLQAVGDAVQRLVVAVDGGGAPSSPARSYLIAADRVVRGWTLELVLVALLCPPALVLFDLLPRCARWGVPLRGALGQWARHAAPGVAAVLVLRLEGAAGIVPGPLERPFPGIGSGFDPLWLALPLAAGALTWLGLRRTRRRLDPDPARAGVASFAAALSGTFAAALVALVASPYLLALVVPALHVWLFLPALQRLGVVARCGAVAVGLLPAALLVWLLAGPGGLGAGDALPWLLRLAANGTLALGGTLALVLVAAAGVQLGALALGRVAGAR